MKQRMKHCIVLMALVVLMMTATCAVAEDALLGYWGIEIDYLSDKAFSGYVLHEDGTGQWILVYPSFSELRPVVTITTATWVQQGSAVLFTIPKTTVAMTTNDGKQYSLELPKQTLELSFRNGILYDAGGNRLARITAGNKYAAYGPVSTATPTVRPTSTPRPTPTQTPRASASSTQLSYVGMWLQVDTETDQTNVFVLDADGTYMSMYVYPHVQYELTNLDGTGSVIVLRGNWEQSGNEIYLVNRPTTHVSTMNGQPMTMEIEESTTVLNIVDGGLQYEGVALLKACDVRSTGIAAVQEAATNTPIPTPTTTPAASTAGPIVYADFKDVWYLQGEQTNSALGICRITFKGGAKAIRGSVQLFDGANTRMLPWKIVGGNIEIGTPVQYTCHLDGDKLIVLSGSGEAVFGRVAPVTPTPKSTSTHTPTVTPKRDYTKEISTAAEYSRRIAVGGYHSIGISANGSVVAVGNSANTRCKVGDWKRIVMVAAGRNHSVGLRSDGTVVAQGLNSSNQCRTSGWRDIVAIDASNAHTVGLRSDGTVVATGGYGNGECEVDSWREIIAVAAGEYHTAGLRSDGTVVTTQHPYPGNYAEYAVKNWTGIVAIAAGNSYTVGLKKDGTVVTTYGASTRSWNGIVDIACYDGATFGLKFDGTIVTDSTNPSLKGIVAKWKNIVAIEGGDNLVGIKADGTVLVAGPNYCDATSDGNPITAVNGRQGRNDVHDWDLID